MRRSPGKWGTGVAVVVASAVCVACGSDDPAGTASGADTGPLALVDGPTDGREALLSGVLVVTDRCVFIEPLTDEGVAADLPGNDRFFVAWSADSTRWSGDAIVIETGDGDVEVRDGDRIAVGGGGSSPGEGGEDFDTYRTGSRWVVPPDPSCATEHRWSAGQLVEPAS